MADTDHLRLLTETAATMDPADETCPTPMSLPVAELQPQDPQTVQPEPQQNDEPLTPTGSTDTTTTTATTIGQPNETDSPMLATKKMRAEDGSAIPTSFVTETTPSKGADARQRETVPRAVAVSPFSTATATDPKVQQIDALRDPNTSQISAENMPAFIKLISNDGFASTLDIRTELLMSVLSTKDPQSLSIFVKDGGLKALNNWLEEIIKDKTAHGNLKFLLRVFDHLPITLEALKSSKIGKTMQKLANTPDIPNDASGQSTQLISKWKKVAHAASIAPDYIKDASKVRKVKSLVEPIAVNPVKSIPVASAAKKSSAQAPAPAKGPLSADELRKLKLKQKLFGGVAVPTAKSAPATVANAPSSQSSSAATGRDAATAAASKDSAKKEILAPSLAVAPPSPMPPQSSSQPPSMGVHPSNGSVNKPAISVKSDQNASHAPTTAAPTSAPTHAPPAIARIVSPSDSASNANGKKPRRRISWAEGDKLAQVRTFIVEEPETPQASQPSGISENTQTLINTLLHSTHDEKLLEKQIMMKEREEMQRRIEAMKASISWSKLTPGTWLLGATEPISTDEARMQIEREKQVPAIPAALVESSPTEPRESTPESSAPIRIIPGEEVQPQIPIIPPPPMFSYVQMPQQQMPPQPQQQHPMMMQPQMQQLQPLPPPQQQPLIWQQPPPQQIYPPQFIPSPVAQQPLPPPPPPQQQQPEISLQTIAEDPNLIMSLIGMLSGQQPPQPQQQPQPPLQHPQFQAPQQLQSPQGIFPPPSSGYPVNDFMHHHPGGGLPYGQPQQQQQQQQPQYQQPQAFNPMMAQPMQQAALPPQQAPGMHPSYQFQGMGMSLPSQKDLYRQSQQQQQQHVMTMQQPREAAFFNQPPQAPSQPSPPMGFDVGERDRFYGTGSRSKFEEERDDAGSGAGIGPGMVDDDKVPYLKRVPCRFWQAGHCSKGSSCQFFHEGVDPMPRGGLIPQPPEDTVVRRKKDRSSR